MSLESENARGGFADALAVFAMHVHVVPSAGMESLIKSSIRLSSEIVVLSGSGKVLS